MDIYKRSASLYTTLKPHMINLLLYPHCFYSVSVLPSLLLSKSEKGMVHLPFFAFYQNSLDSFHKVLFVVGLSASELLVICFIF